MKGRVEMTGLVNIFRSSMCIVCEAQILDASPAEGPASFPSQTQQLLQRAATAASCKTVASALRNEHRSRGISLGLQLWPRQWPLVSGYVCVLGTGSMNPRDLRSA